MKSEITIRTAVPDDAAELLDIYAYYVEKTAITFEYDVPSLKGEPVTYGHSLVSNKKPTLKLAIFRSLPSLMQGRYSYHAGACRSACNRYECFWACPHPHICPRSHIQADP